MELQITQTWHPKVFRTDGRPDGRSGPTTRPAFAKVTQVKRTTSMAFCAHREFQNMPPSADGIFHSIFMKHNNIFRKTAAIKSF